MDLRKGLLPARRDREQDQGIARVADRPHQLQRFLGQPVPRAVDRRRLCADAGIAPTSRRHRLCAGSGLDTASTIVETRCPCARLGAARDGAPTRVLSVSSHFPASGAGTRSLARIALGSTYPTNFFHTLKQLYSGKLCPKIAAAPIPQAQQADQYHETTKITRR